VPQNLAIPILACKQGATLRGIDLEVAAADAKYWWKTGLVPLRPTPLAGSPEAREERELLGLEKTIEVGANSLDEARDELKSQLPEGFQIISEQVISDGTLQTIKGLGSTAEAAFIELQSKVPKGAEIVEKREIWKKELGASAQKTIKLTVAALDEQSARSNAEQSAKERSSNEITVRSITLVIGGKKGFLGIGRRPNHYEVELLEHLPAAVEITYRPRVKVAARMGRAAAAALAEIGAPLEDAAIRGRTVVAPQTQSGSQKRSRYVCAGCGKTLAGDDDLAYATKREADARSLFGDVHKPGMPKAIIEVWDFCNNTFYCQACLDSVAGWRESAKRCFSCMSYRSNFVRIDGIPDFYCTARNNQAIQYPLIDSCEKWQLGGPFRMADPLPVSPEAQEVAKTEPPPPVASGRSRTG